MSRFRIVKSFKFGVLALSCVSLALPLAYLETASARSRHCPQQPIDFSYVGFAAGVKQPPLAPVIYVVIPTGSDDTALLQGAIDAVSKLNADPNGIRGA